jgi:hypothetical protein
MKSVWMPEVGPPSPLVLAWQIMGLAGLALGSSWLIGQSKLGWFTNALHGVPALTGMMVLLAIAGVTFGAGFAWRIAGIDYRVNEYNDTLASARSGYSVANRNQAAPAVTRSGERESTDSVNAIREAMRQFLILRTDPRVYRDYQPGPLCVSPDRIPRNLLAMGAGRLLVKRTD